MESSKRDFFFFDNILLQPQLITLISNCPMRMCLELIINYDFIILTPDHSYFFLPGAKLIQIIFALYLVCLKVIV